MCNLPVGKDHVFEATNHVRSSSNRLTWRGLALGSLGPGPLEMVWEIS